MTVLDPVWLKTFDTEMVREFGIDHSDAGLDVQTLLSYADLPPSEAALAFGRDHDLEFDDALWPRRAG